MSVTVVILVFAGLVLLRVLLVGVGAMAIVRPVRSCPACFQDTIPVQKPLLRRLAPAFEWRWCPSCGWEALARRSDRIPRRAFPQNPPAPPRRLSGTRDADASELDRPPSA